MYELQFSVCRCCTTFKLLNSCKLLIGQVNSNKPTQINLKDVANIVVAGCE